MRRIASMESSVICWIAGRRPSTRLKVNGFDSIRRNRVCSSASDVNTDRGRLCTVAVSIARSADRLPMTTDTPAAALEEDYRRTGRRARQVMDRLFYG